MSLVRLVPWIVHSAVEYAAAVLFLLAPFLFGFDSETAKWTSIALGVLVLLVAVISRGKLGLTQSLPTSAHATLDYVLAVLLVLAPFVLGFADDKAAVTFFVLLGVAHAGLSLLTSFPLREGEPA
ncbi:MAG: SPW repeat domain-containing protein [Mycobacteriales bacterium]